MSVTRWPLVKFMFWRQRSNDNPRQGRATTSSPLSTFRQFIFLSICCSHQYLFHNLISTNSNVCHPGSPIIWSSASSDLTSLMGSRPTVYNILDNLFYKLSNLVKKVEKTVGFVHFSFSTEVQLSFKFREVQKRERNSNQLGLHKILRSLVQLFVFAKWTNPDQFGIVCALM